MTLTKPHIAVDTETKEQFDQLQLKLQASRKTKLRQEEIIRELVHIADTHPDLLGMKATDG